MIAVSAYAKRGYKGSPFEKPYPPVPITYGHNDAFVDGLEARFGSDLAGFVSDRTKIVNSRGNVWDKASGCTVTQDVTVQEASKEDYMRPAYFHYRNRRVVAPHRFFSMRLWDELVGVIAYTYPAPVASGRVKAVGYRPRLKELNEEWTLVSRVIVHPKYRTIGLGARLVRDTLMLTGRRHVELTAVMAQYNPFAERAGMRKILVKEPSEKIVEAVERLRALGFNPALLASRGYGQRKLGSLGLGGLACVHEALLSVDRHYYRRLARVQAPYLKKRDFVEWLGAADTGSLAWSLRILGVLSQTKAYLYWCRDWGAAG